jgi:KipI family sensor histidine kinase inhibitor
MGFAPRIETLGDSAVSLEFGDEISPEINARVMAVYAALEEQRAAGALPGVVELVPSFRALAVHYNPQQTSRTELDGLLTPFLRVSAKAASHGRRWILPACYEPDFAPDLQDIAERANMAPADVVRLHTTTDFTIYILGFVPGFAYMGSVPEPLRFPRRTDPRTAVPAGSVAIAGDITAVYPLESPGGWHLIGRCPVPMFDPLASPPTFLSPGDSVRFQSISADDYHALKAKIDAGTFDVQTLQAEA